MTPNRVLRFPRAFRKAMKTVSPVAKEELLHRSMNLIGALSFAVRDEDQFQISNSVSDLIHFYVQNARAVAAMGMRTVGEPLQNSPKVIPENAEEPGGLNKTFGRSLIDTINESLEVPNVQQ